MEGENLYDGLVTYYDFFAERKGAEEQMIKMAKAMGVENPTSGKDFIRALDELIEAVGCKDLCMSDAGIKEEELAKYHLKNSIRSLSIG